MRTHPTLNVSEIKLDPELVGQVPHALALYYVALPLAREDGQVSVAMAHPENTTALAILGGLLGGPVIPVRGAAAAIRTILDTLRPPPAPEESAILGWSTGSDWSPAVAAWTQVLSAALDAPAAFSEPALTVLGDDLCVPVVRAGRSKLTVLGLRPDYPPVGVLTRVPGPVFFVRSADIRPLRRILVALRGFSSDEHTLDWVASLAQHTGADVTLMPPFGSWFGHRALTRDGTSPSQEHTEVCLHRMQAKGMQATLKLQQGQPAQQIADEFEQGDYDLLVIAAEGRGEFVGSVLAEVNRRPRCIPRPLLVLKPTYV